MSETSLLNDIAKLVRALAIAERALETIADFAPGNGDVCEIIARRAREALAKIQAIGPPPDEPLERPAQNGE